MSRMEQSKCTHSKQIFLYKMCSFFYSYHLFVMLLLHWCFHVILYCSQLILMSIPDNWKTRVIFLFLLLLCHWYQLWISKKRKWSCFKLHVHINATITSIAVLNSVMSLLYAYISDFNWTSSRPIYWSIGH